MEGFDFNALRAKAAQVSQSEMLVQSDGKKSLPERISALEARIAGGISEAEKEEFVEEFGTTPELFLKNLQQLAQLRDS